MRRASGLVATLLAAAFALAGCSARGPDPGFVTGQFIESGGPGLADGQTPHASLAGIVVAFDSAGRRYSVTAASDGRFRLSLPAGTYWLAGFSPQFSDGKGGCPSSAGEPVHVAAGKTRRGLLVICSFP